MPYVHEFGIIANIEDIQEDIGYHPEIYESISVDGDFLDELCTGKFGENMDKLQTFAHSTDRPHNNLCYFGITLIPPDSHTYFLKIVRQANDSHNSEELGNLIKIINKAIKENKWIIHFGV